MSTVTAPILLDSTGQDISAKLQAIANAINGGTIDPITITQDGTYTPSGTTIGYGPVTVNVGGGGGEERYLIQQIAVIINPVGVSISSNSLGADGVNIEGYEHSAGFEGINVRIYNLVQGHTYSLSFKFQSTDAGFFAGEYTLGYKVSDTSVSSYPTSSTPDSSYTAFTRDLTVNNCSTQFTATAENMYIIFAFVGYSDSRQNNFAISDMKIQEVV